ncbi:MAG: phage capsid protein [Candidatus Pelethousia sp.]|nr:phage capsid protein [Candidatus Pelethousia sp.]
MITLAQAKELSQDKLTNYVIDEFRKSALLDSLPFDNTVKPQGGKTLAYVYNRVTTLPTAAGRAINTEYVPQEAATAQVTTNLKVFGGSFQVDRVIAADEKQVVDHIQFQLSQKIQATIALFSDQFINGDSGSDVLQFDGLDKALAGSSTEYTPDAVIDLSSSANIDTNWKVFLDNLRKLRALMDGAPSVYLMNNDMFSVFQSVMDRAGIHLASKENYGDEVYQWGRSLLMALGDKPGTSSPIIPMDTDDTTSIYAARLALDGVHGISPEGGKLVSQYLPNMSTPGAVKTGEVEMVAAMAMKATRSAAVLRDIKL